MQVNITGKSIFGTIRYTLECTCCGNDIILDRKVLLGNVKIITCYKCKQEFSILRMDFENGFFNLELIEDKNDGKKD